MDFIEQTYHVVFVLITKSFVLSYRRHSNQDETCYGRIFAFLAQRDKSHHVIPVVQSKDNPPQKDIPAVFKNLMPLKLDDKKMGSKLAASIQYAESMYNGKRKKKLKHRLFSMFHF